MEDMTNIPVADTLDITTLIEPKRRGYFYIGARDYFQGLKIWKLWLYLAHAEIRRRYRRTQLGPFWSTLSVAIFIGSLGVLSCGLWHQNVREYLPTFSAAYVAWVFFSATVNDSCLTFISTEKYIKQMTWAYSFYAFQVVARNIMVFFHHLIVFIAVAIMFQVPLNGYTVLAIPGLILLFLNCTWISIALGLLCARLRDMQPIVSSVLQIAMFVTPIFWPESQLGGGKIAFVTTYMNPLYHFISTVRYPLLGQPAHLINWTVDIIILLVGGVGTMVYLGRNYNKLIYWL